MFALNGAREMGQKMAEDDDVLNDDDIRKITRLQLINASARFELLSANQQLIDFHLNRVMRTMIKKQEQRQREAAERARQIGSKASNKLSNLYNIEKSVIAEVSEAEENNTTQLKIGHHESGRTAFLDPYYDADRKAEREKMMHSPFTDEMMRDRNRDSMFGTMLLSNQMSKENEARMLQMQDPH